MTYLPAPPDSTQGALRPASAQPFYRRYIVGLSGLLVLAIFLLAPWPFENKARAVMHGLCAQTPSHSFYFGDRALPFDGRMTGIYSGLLVTVIVLVLLGRHRAAGAPSIETSVVLLLFGAAMAIDGFNSLLTDLGRWHPYTPSNEYRLLTGWMAGVGIGVVLVMLIGMTVWSRPRTRERGVARWSLPIALVLPVIPMRMLIGTGSELVYFPLSFFLMASAVMAFTALVLVTVLMLRNRENQVERFEQLQGMTVVSMFVAIVIILAIGGGRFWLEAVTHAPALV
jgi:uncharacterized membrane protein